MITLHRLKGDEFILNEQHIEIIVANPDTVITLTNERQYVVKESVDEIIEKIQNYQRTIIVREQIK